VEAQPGKLSTYTQRQRTFCSNALGLLRYKAAGNQLYLAMKDLWKSCEQLEVWVAVSAGALEHAAAVLEMLTAAER
jgi:hypothetical protein